MEQETINERLNMIVETFESGVKASFARKVGISPQGAQELLAGRKGDPSFKVFKKVLTTYPQVRMEWLVFGTGKMLDVGQEISPAPMSPKEAASRALSVSEPPTDQKDMYVQLKEFNELRDGMASMAFLMKELTSPHSGVRISEEVLEAFNQSISRVFTKREGRNNEPLISPIRKKNIDKK
ncbi:hypothetical protein [Hymenobacter convexus]|uniref:hypothetical protein n=1 Tax=Hymenobacter sp. CA1UV-4 TaxID=3063782 RepID=UPI002712A66F|nr:hypothetical protein [Hymenobacter sp. CA1UV-4]MDO7850408.1 hypothetical protein [Hymenobacter sp. CA1UV-4]